MDRVLPLGNPPYIKEWLACLKELYRQWGGRLNEGGIIPGGFRQDDSYQYASLDTNINQYRIWLNFELMRFEQYIVGRVWTNLTTELFLRREDFIDKVHKLLGVESEITLKGGAANVVLFDKQFLIKGEPQEVIIPFISDLNVQEIVQSLGDFLYLQIKNRILEIKYEVHPELIKAEYLTNVITKLLDFVRLLDSKQVRGVNEGGQPT